jgi:hypothetical protein
MKKFITRYGGWCALLLVAVAGVGAGWYYSQPDLTIRLINYAEGVNYDISKSLDKVKSFEVRQKPRNILDYLDPRDGTRIILPNVIWDDVEVALTVDGFEELSESVPRDRAGKDILFQLKPAPIDLKVVNQGILGLSIRHPKHNLKIPDGGSVAVLGALKYEQKNILTFSAPGYRDRNATEDLDYNRTHYKAGQNVVTKIISTNFLEKKTATLVFTISSDTPGRGNAGDIPSDASLKAKNPNQLVNHTQNGLVSGIKGGVKIYNGNGVFEATISHKQYESITVNAPNLQDRETRQISLELVPLQGGITILPTAAWHDGYTNFIVTVQQLPKGNLEPINTSVISRQGYHEYRIEVAGPVNHRVVPFSTNFHLLPNMKINIPVRLNLKEQDMWDELAGVDLTDLFPDDSPAITEQDRILGVSMHSPGQAIDDLKEWHIKHKFKIDSSIYLHAKNKAAKIFIDDEKYGRYLGVGWSAHLEKIEHIEVVAKIDPFSARAMLSEWEKIVNREFNDMFSERSRKFQESVRDLTPLIAAIKKDINRLDIGLKKLQPDWDNILKELENIRVIGAEDPEKASRNLVDWENKAANFDIHLLLPEHMNQEEARVKDFAKEEFKKLDDARRQVYLAVDQPLDKVKKRFTWKASLDEILDLAFSRMFDAQMDVVDEWIKFETGEKLVEHMVDKNGNLWRKAKIALDKINERYSVRKNGQSKGLVADLNAWELFFLIPVKIMVKDKKRQIQFVQRQNIGGGPHLNLPGNLAGWRLESKIFAKNQPNQNPKFYDLDGKKIIDLFLWPEDKVEIMLQRKFADKIDKIGMWKFGSLELEANMIAKGRPTVISYTIMRNLNANVPQPGVNNRQSFPRPSLNGIELPLLLNVGCRILAWDGQLGTLAAGRMQGVNPSDIFVKEIPDKNNLEVSVFKWRPEHKSESYIRGKKSFDLKPGDWVTIKNHPNLTFNGIGFNNNNN